MTADTGGNVLPTQQLDNEGAESTPAQGSSDGSIGSAMETWLLFTVDDQIYALDLWQVERIVRAVEVTRLPEVPTYVAGVVDVQGQVLPVVDLRLRFDGLTRPVAPGDHFVIAHTATHSVILPMDNTLGSRDIPAQSIPPDTELPRCVRKVMPLDIGVAYLLDLERVMFGDEPPFDSRLVRALAELQGK